MPENVGDNQKFKKSRELNNINKNNSNEKTKYNLHNEEQTNFNKVPQL